MRILSEKISHVSQLLEARLKPTPQMQMLEAEDLDADEGLEVDDDAGLEGGGGEEAQGAG